MRKRGVAGIHGNSSYGFPGLLESLSPETTLLLNRMQELSRFSRDLIISKWSTFGILVKWSEIFWYKRQLCQDIWIGDLIDFKKNKSGSNFGKFL